MRTRPNNILLTYTIVTLYNCHHHHTRSHVTTRNNNENVKLIITRHNNNCTVILELLAVNILLYTSREMCDANVKRATFTMDHRRSTVALFIVSVFDLITLTSTNQRQHVHTAIGSKYNIDVSGSFSVE